MGDFIFAFLRIIIVKETEKNSGKILITEITQGKIIVAWYSIEAEYCFYSNH